MREHIVSEVERHLGAAIDAARLGRLTDDDVRASLDALLNAAESDANETTTSQSSTRQGGTT